MNHDTDRPHAWDSSRCLPDGCVDSHFHALSMAEKGLPAAEILHFCRTNGLAGGMEIGINPAELESRKALCGDDRTFRFSSGIGPSYSANGWEAEMDLLERQVEDREIDSIGEIGIDLHWNYAAVQTQVELFRRQLGIAAKAGYPVVVHNRDADREVLESIRGYAGKVTGVMHCFSSTWETARACIDFGFGISFAGNVTFRNAAALREVAAKIPRTSLLIETDSPYLAPAPVRGRPNTPANIGHVYAAVAETRAVGIEELIHDVGANFSRMFPVRRLTRSE